LPRRSHPDAQSPKIRSPGAAGAAYLRRLGVWVTPSRPRSALRRRGTGRMIGQIISHYRILDRLGEGGMGVVYLAEDLTLRRKVALKFLPVDAVADPDARARLVHEARAAASLLHPNICPVYEIAESE